MHRIAATPGGWNPDTDGVIILEQTPAPIVILTAADTEIQTLAASLPRLPQDFPEFRVASLLQLQQELSIDTYVDSVLSKAKVIVVRLLGGRSYWSYGLERLREITKFYGISLVVLPGDDRPDPVLCSLGTVSLTVADKLWHYFVEGGAENLAYGLQYLAQTCLDYSYEVPEPQAVPQWGEYKWKRERGGEGRVDSLNRENPSNEVLQRKSKAIQAPLAPQFWGGKPQSPPALGETPVCLIGKTQILP